MVHIHADQAGGDNNHQHRPASGLGLGFFLGALLLLGGCDGKSETEANSPKDRHSAAFEEKLQGCAAVAEALGGTWIGKPYDALEPVLGDDLVPELGSLRVIRPGDAVTRDYRLNRLNISLDEADIVTKFYCG